MQSYLTMHPQRLVALGLFFLARQLLKHDVSFWHCFSQSWRAGKHWESFLQAWSSSLQCCWMHSLGDGMAKANLCSAALSQLLAWAHLATSMAAWLPLLGRQTAQHEALVPHFLLQSSRAGIHLGSFWQAAHWAGHFSSIHFWGSLTF